MNKEEREEQEKADQLAPYNKPWFIFIGIIAVLCLVGYIALLA
ncbi:hypothetical protein [Fructobacillus papyrifericola]|nr:hypothetical protein [Fructobacillus papyrifericola]